MAEKWICVICDYIHEGDRPPSFCPVCYASRAKFDPVVDTTEVPPPVEAE